MLGLFLLVVVLSILLFFSGCRLLLRLDCLLVIFVVLLAAICRVVASLLPDLWLMYLVFGSKQHVLHVLLHVATNLLDTRLTGHSWSLAFEAKLALNESLAGWIEGVLGKLLDVKG